MAEQFLRELRQIQQYAVGMRSLLARAQEQMPVSAAGKDSTESVRVELGADGLPERIRVAAGWQRRLDPAEFAAAVTEAFAAANAQRMQAWTDSLRATGWEAEYQRLRQDPVGPASASGAEEVAAGHWRETQAGPPRRLDLITEDLMQAFRALDDTAAQVPATPVASGAAASGRLVITLSMTAGLSCQADPRWLRHVDATDLTAALDVALGEARAGLASAVANATQLPVAGLDRLFNEVLDVLGDPDRLADA